MSFYIRRRLRHVLNALRQAGSVGVYPPGHYYSPIPSAEDLLRSSLEPMVDPIDYDVDGQRRLAADFADDFRRTEGFSKILKRYSKEQSWFVWPDAALLLCWLNRYRPKRIIEVGSGYSTGAMLDFVESTEGSYRPHITLVEPFPGRLQSVMRPNDCCSHIEKVAQEVDPEIFSALEAGDLLFIDSSHVVKYRSDLCFLMFNVLPLLRRGVVVHFHDVFDGWEYPAAWTKEGRYWNELYFLRCFLMYNSVWKIRFFSSFLGKHYNDFPFIGGGSLYLCNDG